MVRDFLFLQMRGEHCLETLLHLRRQIAEGHAVVVGIFYGTRQRFLQACRLPTQLAQKLKPSPLPLRIGFGVWAEKILPVRIVAELQRQRPLLLLPPLPVTGAGNVVQDVAQRRLPVGKGQR